MYSVFLSVGNITSLGILVYNRIIDETRRLKKAKNKIKNNYFLKKLYLFNIQYSIKDLNAFKKEGINL
jgi:hypothetical protein